MIATEDKMLTSKEIAARLCIHIRTLRAWISAGQFPEPIRINRRIIRWSQETFRKYLEEKGGGK